MLHNRSMTNGLQSKKTEKVPANLAGQCRLLLAIREAISPAAAVALGRVCGLLFRVMGSNVWLGGG